jgi:hypothetical protein
MVSPVALGEQVSDSSFNERLKEVRLDTMNAANKVGLRDSLGFVGELTIDVVDGRNQLQLGGTRVAEFRHDGFEVLAMLFEPVSGPRFDRRGPRRDPDRVAITDRVFDGLDHEDIQRLGTTQVEKYVGVERA